ncbi:short-chain fatty acid transporter [Acidimangrovimonas sediminis]|uniref:short-chain fatty acid transporter n=1 Tax=Acidimangrovimonas sediminis TaxID=2056283 RepID=UPI000C80A867|nr:TIGR00366 family protein [Acidimangrovimonas sediminis]
MSKMSPPPLAEPGRTLPKDGPGRTDHEPQRNILTRFSTFMVAFAEKWFPDAYVFVLLAVVIVAAGAVLHGGTPAQVSMAFGEGFWKLIPFTLQMALVAIGGYVVAMSPPVATVMRKVATWPRTGRGAVVMIGLLSIGLSLINWGIAMIFCGLLVKQIARRSDIRLDYRAAGAAAYLCLGCGFTLGISSSAAQLQANATSIPSSLLPITGVIGFGQTILTWQNLVIVLVITLISALVCYFSTPEGAGVRTAEDLGVSLEMDEPVSRKPTRPGEFLEYSPILTILIVVLASGWAIETFSSGNPLIVMSGLNTYNFVFLMLGILLHWRPRNLIDTFARAMPSAAGVLLQFPFYAGIAQILTTVTNGHGATLADRISHWFVGLSIGQTSFSFVVSLYSAFMGFFIPSAGGKWVIEAPYVMHAANEVHAHLGWTVMVYNIAESLPNFINPFWMLPLLGLLGLKSRDLIGYTSVQFFVHLPIMMILGAVLMQTFTYVPPIHP